ncbi:MAG: hypothetical protein JXL97_16150 [Bacteroidales bacterium]|nr:hypothetical protein [Bacteroidales bacterium]
MKFLPIIIAVLTLVGIVFFLIKPKPWEEMSKKERIFIISVIIAGAIALSIGAVAFFFI